MSLVSIPPHLGIDCYSRGSMLDLIEPPPQFLDLEKEETQSEKEKKGKEGGKEGKRKKW